MVIEEQWTRLSQRIRRLESLVCGLSYENTTIPSELAMTSLPQRIEELEMILKKNEMDIPEIQECRESLKPIYHLLIQRRCGLRVALEKATELQLKQDKLMEICSRVQQLQPMLSILDEVSHTVDPAEKAELQQCRILLDELAPAVAEQTAEVDEAVEIYSQAVQLFDGAIAALTKQ